jgi:hypothetical protein
LFPGCWSLRAKNFYDVQSNELTQMSANVILLDRVLAHYGPETKEARDLFRGAVARTLTLFLCALSVSGAIFLILEMYTPFQGLMQISSAPLRAALAHLDQ